MSSAIFQMLISTFYFALWHKWDYHHELSMVSLWAFTGVNTSEQKWYKACLSIGKAHPSRWLCALQCQGERWDSPASTPPPRIRWMTDLETHQNNKRIGIMKISENGGVTEMEPERDTERSRNRNKREREDERTGSKTVGAAFCGWGIYKLIHNVVYKHLSVCQS